MSLDLGAIRARAEAATQGPWVNPGRPDTLNGQNHYVCQVGVFFVVDECDGEPEAADANADAEFISHARTDVPALVAEVERLRRELAYANQSEGFYVGKVTDG